MYSPLRRYSAGLERTRGQAELPESYNRTSRGGGNGPGKESEDDRWQERSREC